MQAKVDDVHVQLSDSQDKQKELEEEIGVLKATHAAAIQEHNLVRHKHIQLGMGPNQCFTIRLMFNAQHHCDKGA